MKKRVKKIHFVGIGGIGMSGIAEVLLSYGYSVSGSDIKKSHLTSRLRSLGAKIYYGHRKANVFGAHAVVYSSAVAMDNPELKEAVRARIPVIQRGAMLSEILRKGFSIAVAGAHGKTTTTAMIGSLLKESGVNPTVIIGGRVKGIKRNAILGSNVFIAEADESDGTFQNIRPNIAIVTNIDREHMDYYGNFRSMEDAYSKFMASIPFDGMICVCGDDKRLRDLSMKIGKRTVFYGFGSGNDLVARGISHSGFTTEYEARFGKRSLGRIRLSVPGDHNVLNSLAALSAGMEMGLPFDDVARGLSAFEGVERRMELKGTKMGYTVIDDYAHHPTEISSTLKTARGVFGRRRFVVVFQPHRYSRLKDLFQSFPESLGLADLVFVTDVYSAGEKRLEGVNASRLVKELVKQGKEAVFLKNWRLDLGKVKSSLKRGDVVFSMGAGDITRFYDHLIKKLKVRPE